MRGATPEEGDLVYVARTGEDYRCSAPGVDASTPVGDPADTWIYYTGRWPPAADPFEPFFDELLAEMESMAGGADRCRWPLDEPWPHGH